MATFAQMKAALDDISTVITQRRKQVDDTLSQTTQAESALTSLQTTYSPIITDINAFLAANPTNDAALVLKAEKDLLVAEFTALKTKATNVKNAITTALNS